MKKLILLLILSGIGLNSYAQNDVKQAVKTENDLKTGNWLDVMTNFSQLAINDLYGANRSFAFKSTIFGILAKTDPNLNIDTTYIKYKFARNLQFNISGNLDQSYKFNGMSLGLTYAIINERDATVFKMYDGKNLKNGTERIHYIGFDKGKPDVSKYFDKFSNALKGAKTEYVNKVIDPMKPGALGVAVTAENQGKYDAAVKSYYEESKKIDAMLSTGEIIYDELPEWAKKVFNGEDIEEYNSKMAYWAKFRDALVKAKTEHLNNEVKPLKPGSNGIATTPENEEKYNSAANRYKKESDKIDSMLAKGKITYNKLPEWAKSVITKTDADVYNSFVKLYLDIQNSNSLKPLLTVSGTADFDAGNLFKQARGEVVYLVGLSKTKYTCELDVRGNFVVRDTITAANHSGFYKKIAAGSIGLNFQLLHGKESKKSILEFKPYFEYVNRLDSKSLGESAFSITANAQVRLRVSDDLWIPVTIKYDKETHNVFSFLNISYNMDAFKAKSKS